MMTSRLHSRCLSHAMLCFPGRNPAAHYAGENMHGCTLAEYFANASWWPTCQMLTSQCMDHVRLCRIGHMKMLNVGVKVLSCLGTDMTYTAVHPAEPLLATHAPTLLCRHTFVADPDWVALCTLVPSSRMCTKQCQLPGCT